MRASGVLLPISSIPSKYGMGCFSKEAYEFVDQLVRAGQQYWQILPLGPTGYGDSPYQSFSTFAGNPYFINLEDLIEKGLLTKEDCEACDWGGNESYVDYEKMYQNRFKLLRKAFSAFDTSDADFQAFVKEEGFWLEDYCLYMAVKNGQAGKGWNEWPKELKNRQVRAMKKAKTELAEEILFYEFQQYFFTREWDALKEYANEHNVKIIGDVPIYVAFDSADTWANPGLFQFNKEREPKSVAGCPPDAFSATGQLWGNPVYNWKNHKKDGYSWWIKRMEAAMKRYDVVRIDHFRGFDEYYAIPYGDKTAENGKWEKGPGLELFEVLKANVKDLDVIAEDLGILTDSVLQMLKDSGFPGMKVLQFAFDSGENSSYLTYKYENNNSVVYTGTHDNETTKGWMGNLSKHDNKFVREYIGCYDAPVNDCVWGLIRTAMRSVSDLCIIPIQDYLCLGNDARMNQPSTLGNNWKWRLKKGEISDYTLYTMRELTRIYGRLSETEKARELKKYAMSERGDEMEEASDEKETETEKEVEIKEEVKVEVEIKEEA